MTQNIHKVSNDSESVVFMNNVPKLRLAQLQAESELFLYPTDFNEMFCISALECLSVGTPIIATRKGALKERVQNGKNGFLIKGKCNTEQYEREFITTTIAYLKNKTIKQHFILAAKKNAEHMRFDQLAQEWVEEFKRRMM
jgi:glycosyltransferase involved in cell wall biosynthesis